MLDLDTVLKAIDDEEELDGEMPDSVWNHLNGNRENTEYLLRETVKLTKENIRERVLNANNY